MDSDASLAGHDPRQFPPRPIHHFGFHVPDLRVAIDWWAGCLWRGTVLHDRACVLRRVHVERDTRGMGPQRGVLPMGGDTSGAAALDAFFHTIATGARDWDGGDSRAAIRATSRSRGLSAPRSPRTW
jgi:hypothetical protein